MRTAEYTGIPTTGSRDDEGWGLSTRRGGISMGRSKGGDGYSHLRVDHVTTSV